MGFIGLGLGLGVFRLADYQIVEADKLRERADARRLLAQTLYAKRGTIYDRNGNVLASSVECRNIAVNPQLVEDVDKTVSALVKATGIDKKTCRKLVESDGTWVYIKRQVDEDDVAALEKKNLPGVLFEQAMKRVYPYGNLASQVLGVVNVDNDGLTGLEKQYNKLLTGTNGSLVRERARDGSYIAGGAYKKVAAVDGVDIVTTLDVNIQRAAEDALAEAVEKTKAKNGSALVTDPTTGEILAACSYPTYDQTDLENAKTEDMNLRLVTDAYEPGSVFKTLVAGAGFDLGVVRSSTSFEVPASIKVGDDTVTDADKRDYAISIDRFGMELADYIKDKGEDYRLILLADEVSQFINKERDRYLNLQEIITKLSEACNNQVWVACTAQQDLSEIMDDCNIGEEKDKEGKIKGRFEVKVSLKGTQPEVITQKRILEKKPEVKTDLAAMYEQQQGAFSLQFKLPNAYKSYDTETDFIDFYPFVPYQFKLIMQVFDSFLALGYVAKEVKGNERSIIKVIHATAKAPNNAQAEVGKFVSFDELYNNMFEEGLQARGQKAVDNAIRIARTLSLIHI